MQVRVLLFAAYREIVGAREIEIEAPESSTVEDIFHMLEREHAGLAQLRRSTSFAVNRTVVHPQQVVRDGDEIAFLQPVSGGMHD